jgi:hypothetical protein
MTTIYLQDSAVVDALIENTGGRQDMQDITLEYDDGGTPQQADTVPGLTLQPGGDVTRALVYTPSDTETGTWTLTVASDDDTATATLDVLKPFDVTITNVSPSNPDPGETTLVTFDLTNVSSTARTVETTLDVDGSQEDSLVLAGIGAGATATVTLAWTPQSDGGKTVTATAVAASDSTTVTVGGGISQLGDTQYYTDAGSGSTLIDDLGTVDATISGATWQTGTGVNNAYLSFDGSDDLWSTDSTKDVSQFTVFAAVRPDDFTAFDNTILGAGDGVSGDNNGFQIQTDGTDLVGSQFADGNIAETNNRDLSFVSSGNWGFVGLIYDGSDSRMITWDTSQELTDDTASVSKNPSGSETYHGGGVPVDGDHLDGALDFVMLNFGSTLSKADLTTLWNDTKGNY